MVIRNYIHSGLGHPVADLFAPGVIIVIIVDKGVYEFVVVEAHPYQKKHKVILDHLIKPNKMKVVGTILFYQLEQLFLLFRRNRVRFDTNIKIIETLIIPIGAEPVQFGFHPVHQMGILSLINFRIVFLGWFTTAHIVVYGIENILPFLILELFYAIEQYYLMGQ
tara:strand:- start:5581 stop:6075 length:495 start_codon:yes stop_codon:yes gene_type:complete